MKSLADLDGSGVPPRDAWAVAGRLLAWAGRDRVTVAALCLTVAGWSLMWAAALSNIGRAPVWLGLGTFFLGLALIPFRRTADRRRSDAGTRE